MNLKKFLPFIIILSLFACSKPALEQLAATEGNLRSKNTYDSYLALEYLEFARGLKRIKENSTSKHFAHKGLSITHGAFAFPENPLKWGADKLQIEEMVLMQKRLENVLKAPQIKAYLPIQTAHLTYLYDCWISRESKAIFRADELGRCKTRFYRLIGEIESYIDDLNKDKTPKVIITEPEFERFEISFDFNSDKFNDKANKDLIKILKHISDLKGDYRILVVGNADRVGKEIYNQDLAIKRAQVTENYLIKNGVMRDFVAIRSVGEDFPDIITKDNIQAQSNRTVGIYILKGAKSFADYPLPLIENYVYAKEVAKARKERGLK